MKKINFYRYPHPNNIGDLLTPYILQAFIPDAEFVQVPETTAGKLIMVGSIMRVIKSGDTILGSGVMREDDQFYQAKECKFLAVRGKLSRNILLRYGAKVPAVFGDPAILLPLFCRPTATITHQLGIIPHFVDKRELTPAMLNKIAKGRTYKIIDVFLPLEQFVTEILSCKEVVSSSLHGIIIAEAYGLPAEWIVLSNRVIGNGFKFRDYLTGTGRELQGPGKFPPLDPQVLNNLQQGLIKAMKKI